MAPPAGEAAGTVAVEAWTSIIEERSVAPVLGVPGAGAPVTVLTGRSVAGAADTTAIGLESGAGAG
ncbi:MAG: hypothetical protein M3505_12455, partial [Verrucomicrobiota bacterium]|nr:hypothetical protein [Verrucomicrobiota bacterium]